MSQDGVRVVGVKFASNPHGTRGRFFHGSHGEPASEAIRLDYFVWGIQTTNHTLIVDTGFTPEVAKERQRKYLRTPADALKLVGVEPGDVDLVALSHLHFDHAGGLQYFPKARFVVQRAEYEFWLDPLAKRGEFAHSVDQRDLDAMVAISMAGRLVVIDGTAELVPGVWAHHVGGHTVGSQVFHIEGDRPAVLACDASHFYQNVCEDIPFAVLHDLPGVYRAFDRLKELAGSGLVVPGHDPALFDRFNAVPGLDGVAFEFYVDNC